MKKYTKALLGLMAMVMITVACKLDKPVTPPVTDPPGTTDGTVLGIVVQGKVIDDAYLTALWKTSKTVQQLYDTSNVVVSGVEVPNKFSAVLVDDHAKSAKYTGLATDLGTTSYKLSTTDNVLFINLSPNPFFSSLTSRVRITHLTPAAMTWVALDTAFTPIKGKYFHKGYQVTFTK
ncbi:hypothetical protein [Mucilaginibacter sp. UR6-11]|uniref:hypothetical protein n=1 Tax=Mucilaginibacter sp. UR6-11 TaxID=1435644 RepID=UPI001E2E068D|nr:hypothetical protein [Mucilaginibacter sp. UR6-11]MCC8424084.1 hypothetical protein [Mucilaginibacter sp. UR6-11]